MVDKIEPGAILRFPYHFVMYLGEAKEKRWFFYKKGNYGLCEVSDKEDIKRLTGTIPNYVYKVVDE